MKTVIRHVSSAAVLSLFVTPLFAQDGPSVYRAACASCHDAGIDKAPTRATLMTMTPERVLASLESGSMISMTAARSASERRAVAEFVTGKSFKQPLVTRPAPQTMCTAAPQNAPANPLGGPSWNGWGVTSANTRFQDAAAGLTASSVPRLKVKWAFGFPGDIAADAQPTVAGGRVYVGSQSGNVYALDAATGCIRWFFQAAAAVRAAVTIGRIETPSGAVYAAFIGDRAANVYAVDAGTGKLLWKTKADEFPVARVTGTPAFDRGRLYVPVASGEETAGAVTTYECCRFRGSLVALNAATGAQIWKTYTIAEDARPTKKNKAGTQMWGPSGAPIWSAPAIDSVRNAVYVTTGDNYSDPPSPTSDAFMAFDLESGKVLWSRQVLAADAWNGACIRDDTTNCPASNGPDFDFASPPILVTLAGGRRALVAGQKSGLVHAVDPDKAGAVLWQRRLGKGGINGGVQWGSSADQANVYVALSDLGRIPVPHSTVTDPDPKVGGGLFALRLDNGEQVWFKQPAPCGQRARCSPAQSAAVSAVPGVVFSGSVDGHLRAFSTTNGQVLWDFDTVGPQKTVNEVPARGGSLNGPGPAIAGGMLFVESGYAANGMPGNVLLAFSIDGR
ncbi:MAG TPA: PQQ-binding-like beta-propeller repeat protein [Vicinamibacterales bacterium]|nr:PQQ-binding-like beta-propeller repeat protein [Vicinamibacterales bacterium]